MQQQELDTTVINWTALGVDPKIIVENSERIRGRFIPNPAILDEPCAVVAYGPSLLDTWKEIRDYNVIFTCSGAHKFLIDKGIIPTYHCESDPRGHKVAMLGDPNLRTTYLIASICHSNYFDVLEAAEADIRLWHILFDEDEIYKLVPKGDWLVCGGNTIGPRSVKLARLSGYVNLHLFGFDGSGKHAGAHTNAPPEDRYLDVNLGDRTFRMTDNLLYQSRVFFEDLDRMSEVNATWHGDGFMQCMASRRTPKKLPRRPIGVQK